MAEGRLTRKDGVRVRLPDSTLVRQTGEDALRPGERGVVASCGPTRRGSFQVSHFFLAGEGEQQASAPLTPLACTHYQELLHPAHRTLATLQTPLGRITPREVQTTFLPPQTLKPNSQATLLSLSFASRLLLLF